MKLQSRIAGSIGLAAALCFSLFSDSPTAKGCDNKCRNRVLHIFCSPSAIRCEINGNYVGKVGCVQFELPTCLMCVGSNDLCDPATGGPAIGTCSFDPADGNINVTYWQSCTASCTCVPMVSNTHEAKDAINQCDFTTQVSRYLCH
jgi:hypothetical protein